MDAALVGHIPHRGDKLFQAHRADKEATTDAGGIPGVVGAPAGLGGNQDANIPVNIKGVGPLNKYVARLEAAQRCPLMKLRGPPVLKDEGEDGLRSWVISVQLAL